MVREAHARGHGGVFAMTVLAGAGDVPWRMARAAAGPVFGLGLLAATIGNLIGGALLVGAGYWLVGLRPRRAA